MSFRTDSLQTLMAKADIIDETATGEIYLGYTKGAAATSDALFAIMKVETSGTITSRMWVNGVNERTFIWDDRASYSYEFRKF